MHISAIAIMLLLVAQGAAPPAPSFCERLATGLEMKATRKASSPKVWEFQTLNVAQRFLVGGSTSFSVQVGSTTASTAEEYRRLSEVCKNTPKEIVCNVAGPMDLTVQVKDKQAKIEAASGERADVTVVGTRLRCEDQ